MINTHDPELNLLACTLGSGSFDPTVMRSVKADYFADDKYREVWNFVLEHWRDYGKVPAMETVTHEFAPVSGFLVRANPHETAKYYADQLIDKYITLGIATKMQELAPELEHEPVEALTKMRHLLGEYDLVQNEVSLLTLENTASERWERYTSEKVYGVPFTWPTLERATRGAHPADLIGFVARPGGGKTMMLIYLSLHAWREDHRVLVVASEIPAINMIMRLDAMYLEVDYDLFKQHALTDIKRDQYKQFLTETERGGDYVIVDGMGMTPSSLAVLVEQVKPDIVYLDGVYMMESDRSYREDWQKIRHLGHDLKTLAKRYNVPVVYNSQFSRSVGSTHGSRSKKALQGGLEDMAYGDAFGHYSDLVIGIMRTPEDLEERCLSMKVIKGREAADGVFWRVHFDFDSMDFSEVGNRPAPKEGAEVDW